MSGWRAKNLPVLKRDVIHRRVRRGVDESGGDEQGLRDFLGANPVPGGRLTVSRRRSVRSLREPHVLT